MDDLVDCSAGFFFYEEKAAKWFILGMSCDFDTAMLPTVSSNKGKIDAYKLLVGLFQKLGWHQLNSFTSVYKDIAKLAEGKGEILILSYLVNDMLTSFSEPLSELPVGGIETIGNGQECYQLFFWEVDRFASCLVDKKERKQFKELVNAMSKDTKFLHDHRRLIINVNNPSWTE